MSEGTDTDMENPEVFVGLLDEGVDVLRPTRAVACGGSRFRLLGPEDHDPEEERWEFPPGSVVECRLEVRAGREIRVARSREG